MQDEAPFPNAAAERGDAEAQFNLAVLHADGRGVSQDYGEAAKWYRRAAEQGHSYAQFNLGLMHAYGQGVAQDSVQAHLWLDLAAAQAVGQAKDACAARDALAARMTAAQIAEARRLTREWRPKTWEQLKGK